MKLFKVKLTETVEGTAEVAARDEDHAVEIANAVLLDDGITAFADLVVVDRDFYARGMSDDDDETTTIDELRQKLEEEWGEDDEKEEEEEDKEE